MLNTRETQYQFDNVKRKIKELFEGYAGEVRIPEPETSPMIFGLGLEPDPHDMPEVSSRTFEWAHFLLRARGETPEEAYQKFAEQVHGCLPWPSLKPRFHICWRRMPQFEFDQAFDSMESYWKITARYSLVLDWEPPETKKAGI